MQKFSNLIILFTIFISVMFIYKRLEDKRIREDDKEDYDNIRQYLLNDDLGNSTKPILWIHIPYEYNSRNWLSFGSRSSLELNQPYLYLSVKSIIQRCSNSFRICIIDDMSFAKLIPDWQIDMQRVSHPISDKLRSLAMVKLLYIFGGMVVPMSFLCFQDLITMYENGILGDKAFVCENIDRNITSTSFDFYPTINFMGSQKANPVISALNDFMQRTISTDFTAESVFLGEFDRWVDARVNQGLINVIRGRDVGIKNMEDKPVLLEDLMSQNYIDFYPQMYGIWIPSEQILSRRQYGWFARLSATQVLEADNILSKYMVLANAPEDVTETLVTMTPNPSWVSFWRVPSQAPVWGLKPNYLGNNVRELTAPQSAGN
jgi:hypothetical protein